MLYNINIMKSITLTVYIYTYSLYHISLKLNKNSNNIISRARLSMFDRGGGSNCR